MGDNKLCPALEKGWAYRKSDPGGDYVIEKPSWKTSYDESSGQVTLEPYISEMNRKAWVIEERMLFTQVVDILRSNGYTVIEPEAEGVHDDY